MSTIMMVENACRGGQIAVKALDTRQTVYVAIWETISVLHVLKMMAMTECTRASVIVIPASQ
jgi:hypothetical protein